MLYSVLCFQVDVTPEESSLTRYVSAVAEQTARAWGQRHDSGQILPNLFQEGRYW